jgi:hypothetical protein
MKRREFVSGAVSCGVLLGAGIGCEPLEGEGLRLSIPDCTQLLHGRRDRDDIMTIPALEERLALTEEDYQRGPEAVDLTPGASQRLIARSTQDYSQGRTVVVKGWVLSRTELSLCWLAVAESPSSSKSANRIRRP